MQNVLPPLHIGNNQIKCEFQTKFLRACLDENISWRHHINIVSTMICKKIGILSRTRFILNEKNIRNKPSFYFINCYLNYANIAWASKN